MFLDISAMKQDLMNVTKQLDGNKIIIFLNGVKTNK